MITNSCCNGCWLLFVHKLIHKEKATVERYKQFEIGIEQMQYTLVQSSNPIFTGHNLFHHLHFLSSTKNQDFGKSIQIIFDYGAKKRG